MKTLEFSKKLIFLENSTQNLKTVGVSLYIASNKVKCGYQTMEAGGNID